MENTLQGWLSQFNVFSDVDFSKLYGWLPSDVQGVCGFVIGFLMVLACIGIVKRFLLR